MNPLDESKISCCCDHDDEHNDVHQATEDQHTTGMTFKVEGLDCVEEVSLLKSGIGQMVGGDEKLSFDVIKGRMSISDEALQVSEKKIIKAVAAMGMKARRWNPGEKQLDTNQRQRSQTFYASLSGLFILLGILLHIFDAAGFKDIKSLVTSIDSWSYSWDGLKSFLLNQLNAKAPQNTFWAEQVAYGFAIISGIRHVVVKAFYAIKRLRADMNLLMLVAIIGAIFINEWFEAAAVSFLFSLSLALESWSIGRARHAVESLLESTPTLVTVKNQNGQEQNIAVEEIKVGTQFIVNPGNKIPLDGIIIAGISSVNQAPITGESIPVAKQIGDEVFAGSINGEAMLEIKANKIAADTTLAHIIRLVEEAHSKRAKVEQWVEKFARIYTPIVMMLSLAVFTIPFVFFSGSWDVWLYKALVLLVIACPCALVISTPVSIVASLACAARQGVLIKGGVYIEAPAHLEAIAFDKTGTLTSGHPLVTAVYPLSNLDQKQLLSLASALEARADHPIANAIVNYSKEQAIQFENAKEVYIVPGKGVTGLINETEFWLGSRRYLLERGQETGAIIEQAESLEKTGQTVIAIGNKQNVLGLIAIADNPRPQIQTVLQSLKDNGIKHIAMLTGDNNVTAKNIASQIGVDQVYAELLPVDKVEIVSQMVEKYANVAMVGDGINDAPALGRATLGIAMGAMGSDVAIETADIALMGDDLSRLPWLINHSKRTLRIIRQNIVFALAIKAAFAVLAFVGMATLWQAIAADMGASLLVVANGLRLLKPKNINQQNS